jgi:dynein heavy chain
MLEAFDYLAKRETIKQVIKKKAQFVLNLFYEELEGAKNEFENMKNNA